MPKRGRKPRAAKSKSDPTMDQKLLKTFCVICDEATKTDRNHDKYLLEVKKLLEKETNVNITNLLVRQTKIHFALGDDNPQVVLFMHFVAIYLHSLESENIVISNMTNKCDGDIEMHVCMKNMFHFCIDISNSDTHYIRKLALQFINIILNKMGDGSLEDDLFDKLTTCVLDRMQDTHYKVRSEAMVAARRLQEPRLADDAILKAYRFHLRSDPIKSVREAVLTCIGCTAHSIDVIIERTADTDESVRMLAYERLSEVSLKTIKLKQRQELLRRGLNDKAVKVRNFIESVFIPRWIEHCQNSLLNLFDNIRYDINESEKITYDKMAYKVMQSLYANYSVSDLCTHLGLDCELKSIPVSQIRVHTLVYWRCLATCIQKDGADIDLVLPVLSMFVDLMEKHDSTYGHVMESAVIDNNVLLDQMEFNSSRLELLRMLHLFDRSDEVGREKLKTYLFTLLSTDDHLNEYHVKEIVIILKEVCITFADWQRDLLNIVTNIYQPPQSSQDDASCIPVPIRKSREDEVKKTMLKMEILALVTERENAIEKKDYTKAQECDDKIAKYKTELDKMHSENIIVAPLEEMHIQEQKPAVTTDVKKLVKAFMILYFMLSEFNYRLTPEMRIMLQDVIHQQLKSECIQVEYWSLKCCICICIEDLTIARQYFPLFFIKLFSGVSLEENFEKYNISDLALMCIIDLFCTFSLEDFQMGEGANESNTTKHRRLYPNRTDTELNEPEASDEDETVPQDDNVQQVSFIEIISKLLQDCESHSTRLIVIQGLAKLFLNNKMKSKKVLGMLLLLYHHPEMDLAINSDLRQHIVIIFAEMAAGSGGGPEAIVYSLIPAIKIRVEAPPESPLQQIDLFDISKFVLTLTAVEPQGENFHTLIALTICDELKRMRRDENLEIILTRTLVHCNLRGDEQLKADLKLYMQQLIPSMVSKISQRYLRQALKNLKQEDNVTIVTNSNATSEQGTHLGMETQNTITTEAEMMDVDT